MNCPILNKRQKSIRNISILLIIITLIVWVSFGMEFFTKTEVLVEVNDELYGTIKEWKDQFVLGLDYTLAVIGGIVAIGASLIFLTRSKITN